MKHLPTPAALAAATLFMLAGPAAAQVYGSLANFDSVNDTGHEAHGFEIQILDPSYDRSKLTSVFGLDRNFGVPPTSVERYGAPTITELPGVGVTVRYAATFANGAWSVGTPSGPYSNAGDSCWPLGNPQYASLTLTCDHFGVGTYGTPAKVTYSWLLDIGNTGTLAPVQATLPPVAFFAQPAPADPNAPRPVAAEIEAHKAENEVFGTPYWVKVYSKHLDHNVALDDLMHRHADVPGDDAVEVEFEIFQAGDAGGNGKKHIDLAQAQGDAALVLRYEFYQYVGALLPDGEADCRGKHLGPADCGGLGEYVGAQIAGFNEVQPPLAAVPEPESYAMLLAGLGVVAMVWRRRGASLDN